MVYVTDGNMVDSVPWTVRRIFGIFTGIIYMVIMFFQTLINPDRSTGSQSTRDYRPGSGPRPPTRRLGRPNTRDNVNIPFCGSCHSCAG